MDEPDPYDDPAFVAANFPIGDLWGTASPGRHTHPDRVKPDDLDLHCLRCRQQISQAEDRR